MRGGPRDESATSLVRITGMPLLAAGAGMACSTQSKVGGAGSARFLAKSRCEKAPDICAIDRPAIVIADPGHRRGLRDAATQRLYQAGRLRRSRGVQLRRRSRLRERQRRDAGVRAVSTNRRFLSDLPRPVMRRRSACSAPRRRRGAAEQGSGRQVCGSDLSRRRGARQLESDGRLLNPRQIG